MSIQHQQEQSPATAKRVIGLVDRTIAGPIASLVVSHSMQQLGSQQNSRKRNSTHGRLSDSGGGHKTRFCTTKTGEKPITCPECSVRMSDFLSDMQTCNRVTLPKYIFVTAF